MQSANSITPRFLQDSSYSASGSCSAGHPHLTENQVFTKTGTYKGNFIAVKELKRRTVSVDRALLMELEEVRME